MKNAILCYANSVPQKRVLQIEKQKSGESQGPTARFLYLNQ